MHNCIKNNILYAGDFQDYSLEWYSNKNKLDKLSHQLKWYEHKNGSFDTSYIDKFINAIHGYLKYFYLYG